jgi:hypothetical protein
MSQVITHIVDLLRRFLVGLYPSIARVVIFILFWYAVRFTRVAFGRDAHFHGIFFLLMCTI